MEQNCKSKLLKEKNVVSFKLQTGALHPVSWQKSFFQYLKLYSFGFFESCIPATTLGHDVILGAIWKLTREAKARVRERVYLGMREKEYLPEQIRGGDTNKN